MAKFEVLVRAVVHCTRELVIEAPNEDVAKIRARVQAMQARNTGIGWWELSDPEDIEIESSKQVSAETERGQ
jgi:hypothetical protein